MYFNTTSIFYPFKLDMYLCFEDHFSVSFVSLLCGCKLYASIQRFSQTMTEIESLTVQAFTSAPSCSPALVQSHACAHKRSLTGGSADNLSATN